MRPAGRSGPKVASGDSLELVPCQTFSCQTFARLLKGLWRYEQPKLFLTWTQSAFFACMYDQTFASLALAKLIKEKHPEKLIVFGGYALEKPVGPQIFSSFPFVDVVVFGESEEKIAPLAQGSIERDDLRYIPNILFRDSEGHIHQTPPGSRPINLDESPIPEYDDYFKIGRAHV